MDARSVPSKNELKKRQKAEEKEKLKAEKAAKVAKEQEEARRKLEADDVRMLFQVYTPSRIPESSHPAFTEYLPDFLTLTFPQEFCKQFYGKLPLNQSQSRPKRAHASIPSLVSMIDQPVVLRARIQTSRATGNKMVFLLLRQRIDTIQGLVTVAPGKVSQTMAKWVSGLQEETIVLVEGIVRKSVEEVKSATVKDVEIHVSQVSAAKFSVCPLLKVVDSCM